MGESQSFFDNYKLQLAIIFFITIFAYSNSLTNGLVWDDEHFIEEWALTQTWGHIPELLLGATPHDHKGVYRPLRSMLYVVSYSLFEANPVWYHVQALVIHLICTWLIFRLLKKLNFPKKIIFIATLLFGVHPIHTEAITFVTTSFDIVGVIFMICSLLAYLDGKRSALVWATLAFFTYELTLSLPFVIALVDWYRGSLTRENYKVKLKGYFYFVALFVIYFLIRTIIVDKSRGEYLGGSLWVNMLMMSVIVFRYVVLLLAPSNLTVVHEIVPGVFSNFFFYEAVPSITLTNPFVLVSFLFTLSVLLLTFLQLRKRSVVGFILGWFFVTLIPVSNIIPLGTRMAEKYLYLASIAACVFLAYTIIRAAKVVPRNYRKGALVMLIACVTTLGVGLTIERNNDWKSNVTLWESAIESAPFNSMVVTNLGAAYISEKNYAAAQRTFEYGTKLNPKDHLAYNNLGVVAREMGDSALALTYYLKSYELDQDNRYALGNIPGLYFELGEFEKAKEYYVKLLALEPARPIDQNNLGWMYFQEGNIEKALHHLEIARSLAPDDEQILRNIGKVNEAILAEQPEALQ